MGENRLECNNLFYTKAKDISNEEAKKEIQDELRKKKDLDTSKE